MNDVSYVITFLNKYISPDMKDFQAKTWLIDFLSRKLNFYKLVKNIYIF